MRITHRLRIGLSCKIRIEIARRYFVFETKEIVLGSRLIRGCDERFIPTISCRKKRLEMKKFQGNDPSLMRPRKFVQDQWVLCAVCRCYVVRKHLGNRPSANNEDKSHCLLSRFASLNMKLRVKYEPRKCVRKPYIRKCRIRWTIHVWTRIRSSHELIVFWLKVNSHRCLSLSLFYKSQRIWGSISVLGKTRISRFIQIWIRKTATIWRRK